MHLQRLKKYGELEPHEQKSSHTKLSKRFSSEYQAWKGAKERCLNPNNRQYKSYGGRGIKFADSWQGAFGFEHFLKDMGPKPSDEVGTNGKTIWTLDRIGVNGDYCKEN